jgi:hypothetical protein
MVDGVVLNAIYCLSAPDLVQKGGGGGKKRGKTSWLVTWRFGVGQIRLGDGRLRCFAFKELSAALEWL